MKLITANLKNESAKIFAHKKYIVFMIIEVIICIGAVCSKLLAARLSNGMLTMSNISTSITMMSLFFEAVIPFISIMAVCELFSAEFHSKTIRSIFVRPAERYKVYIGKISAVLILAVINMAVVFIASSAADFAVSGKVVSFGYSLSAYILDIIPMLVVILMAVMLNQIVKSSTMAMFLCIIVYAGLKVMGISFSSLSGLVFTGYMQWHKIWLGGGMPYLAASFKALLLLGYGLTFGAVGYYIFRFKEC